MSDARLPPLNVHAWPRAAPLAVNADSVYFLMYAGWANELRANRWHYARRWGGRLPVVLVQPTQRTPAWHIDTEPEPRLENCSILNILAPDDPLSAPRSAVQIAQVTAHLRQRGFERPLLWCYNPNLLGVYGGVPAVARVFHATENFADTAMPAEFHTAWKAATAVSDLVVTVSDGVADSVREHVRGVLVESANGCDYAAYANAEPSAELRAAATAFSRTAVYAGNVNWRVDSRLLAEAARRHRDVFFAFYGPVALEAADLADWNRLVAEPNVRYFGPVDPDALPSLYHAADLGLIPYKQLPTVVENGFPLKTLEMGAAGLPVVSTLMKPIEGLAAAIVVTPSGEAFIEAIARTDRGRTTAAERDELRRIAQASDYDVRFREVLDALARLPGNRSPATRLDEFAAAMLAGADVTAWKTELVKLAMPRLAVPLAYERLASLLPARLRQAVPPGWRRSVRRVVGR